MFKAKEVVHIHTFNYLIVKSSEWHNPMSFHTYPTFNCTLSSLHKINIAIKPEILKMVIKSPLGLTKVWKMSKWFISYFLFYLRANGFITPRKWSMRSNVKLLDHHPTILLQHTIELIPSWHAYGRRLLFFQVHLQAKNAQ